MPIVGIGVLTTILWMSWKPEAVVQDTTLLASLIGQPDPSAIDYSVISDQFLAEPCYFFGSQTCQLSFYLNIVNKAEIQLSGSRLVQPQRQQDLWFLTSRMLTQPSQFSHRFRQEIIDQADPNPFYISVIQIIRVGLMYDINPALLFSYYDLLLSSGEKLDIEIPVVEGELVPKAEDVALAMATAKESDDVASKSWTKAGQTILQVSAELLPPALVQEMFAEAGELERRYLDIFAPQESERAYGVQYLESSVAVEQVFGSEDGGESQPFFTALCRNLQAYVCRVVGSDLQCSLFPQYDLFCSSYLLTIQD